MLESSIQLNTHAGAELSLKGKKYLYYDVRTNKRGRLACGIQGGMVLVDLDGPTDDDDDDNVFL